MLLPYITSTGIAGYENVANPKYYVNTFLFSRVIDPDQVEALLLYKTDTVYTEDKPKEENYYVLPLE